MEYTKIKSIKKVGVKKVYDIECFPNHNFIVNGVLAHNCIFCGNNQKKLRFRNPDNIYEELLHLESLGYEMVYLLDDCFVANKDHFIQVTHRLACAGLPYRCTTRTNLVNDLVAERLAWSGCEVVSVGIESANNKTLQLVGKVNTVENHEKAINCLHKAGIKVKGFFIIGLPGEDYADVMRTIRWACSMKRHGLASADFYALVPFPGSELSENPEKYGIRVLDDDYSNYLQAGRECVEPVLETDRLSRAEIKELLEVAKDEFGKTSN